MDLTLQSYTTTTQLHNDFYNKSKTNLIFEEYYDKAETDNLLANKVSTTGNVTLIGSVLSVGGVTNEDSSIYIHAAPANYTGY